MDKAEVAARVAWSGTGLNLKASKPMADMVANAVRKILVEPGFQFHAKRLAAEYAQYDAVKRGVAAIEELKSEPQNK